MIYEPEFDAAQERERNHKQRLAGMLNASVAGQAHRERCADSYAKHFTDPEKAAREDYLKHLLNIVRAALADHDACGNDQEASIQMIASMSQARHILAQTTQHGE